MTLAQYRALASNTERIREILNDPVFATLIVVLRDSNTPEDVAEMAPEVSSVRALSKRSGYAECLDDLLSAAIPTLPPLSEMEEDWGVETSKPDQTMP